jgi:uncharacterized protein
MKRNPFIIAGYSGAEYFCNRELETEKLISAINNQRNTTLFSLRRMGKTGLIWHVFHHFKKEKTILPVYIDLMPSLNLSDFTVSFAKAILSALAQKKSTIEKIFTSLASLRPTLNYDPLTGQPEVSIKVDSQTDFGYSLESIFQLLSGQNQQFIIALDEFQQVTTYPEKEIEALLRSHIQKINNATFIFSGSQKHILTEIFSSPTRPFFNSTEKMQIGTIASDIYKEFIEIHFRKNKMNIQTDALDEIERRTGLHTFYVQFLCNRLYSNGPKFIEKREVELMYRQVIAENEPIYASYINLITSLQFRLLKALAKDGGGGGVTSKDYLTRHNLGAASSVNTALKSLFEKDFIHFDDEKYFLNDKFFQGWLAHLD